MLLQTLKFSNSVKLTHDAASKSLEKYCKAVESGKIVIEGMTATFHNSEIVIKGIQRNPVSTRKILRGV